MIILAVTVLLSLAVLGRTQSYLVRQNEDYARQLAFHLNDVLFAEFADRLQLPADSLLPDTSALDIAVRHLLIGLDVTRLAIYDRPAPVKHTGLGQLPAWLQTSVNRPQIYVTLGTLFNSRTDVFAQILTALRDEPVEIIVTVGRDGDPAQFGPQPPNVHIERFVPQNLLYPHCAAAVIHGGSGTMIGALQHGLPLVVMPLGADHPGNTLGAQAAGVARVLDPARMTTEDVRDAVLALLTRSACRCGRIATAT